MQKKIDFKSLAVLCDDKTKGSESKRNDRWKKIIGCERGRTNLYFPSIFIAYLTLVENMKSNDDYMKRMAEFMMIKFEKYWSSFSLTLAIAVILDPRYKIDFVEWSYKEVYGSNSMEFEQVRSKLFSVFNEYASASLSSSAPKLVNKLSHVQEVDDNAFTLGIRAKLLFRICMVKFFNLFCYFLFLILKHSTI